VRRLVILLTAFVIAATGLSACTDLVVGDSLVVGAAATEPGASVLSWPATNATSLVDGVVLRGVAGVAPCDYRGLIAGDIDKWHPGRVSLAFSGNNSTQCMRDAQGRPLTGAAMVAKYRADLVWLTQYLVSRSASVIYSAPLCVAPGSTLSNGNPALRTMERDLASSFVRQGRHVAYSEYAARQVCPNWTYVRSLRAADGLHLSTSGGRIYAAALRYENKHTAIP
jgi:hypothetical protein